MSQIPKIESGDNIAKIYPGIHFLWSILSESIFVETSDPLRRFKSLDLKGNQACSNLHVQIWTSNTIENDFF